MQIAFLYHFLTELTLDVEAKANRPYLIIHPFRGFFKKTFNLIKWLNNESYRKQANEEETVLSLIPHFFFLLWIEHLMLKKKLRYNLLRYYVMMNSYEISSFLEEEAGKKLLKSFGTY